jgi:FAD/FMN-containing dehydrogenase/Fe-S oxidoreductase
MLDTRELKRRALERHLKKTIQGEVRFDPPTRRLYSTDASIYQIEPLGVVLPHTVDDLRMTIQVAAEHQIPIVPRGGGTSLSGQSIGPGVVIDCSKYLHHIIDFDPQASRVRVQPGVILDHLNRFLEPHGLQFGPDVATSSRANLGGMIGNNSAGSRSIVYGKTLDHVRELDVILADGSTATFAPVTPAEWQRNSTGRTLEAGIYRAVRPILHKHRAEIDRRFPKILRRVSGYNFDTLLAQLDGPSANLATLVVGSEGTLAFTTEAELSVIPRPKVRGLLVPHYSSLAAAMDTLDACLEMRPSAVELLDQLILDLAHENLALQRQMAAIQGRPAALFMVEFSGDDPREVEGRLGKLERWLKSANGVTAVVKATEPDLRESLWNLRRAGLPLLLGLPGDRKPVTFVEDTAVAPDKLPEFVARFRELLQRHGTDGAFYGHASVGCLHIRPVLNLKDAEDVARMRRITEEVTDLVLSFGGALSGEHGDGLARSEWNRKMFGEEIYQAFRQVKRAFDPDNLFNPGKVVDAPAMTDNLRYGPNYRPEEPATVFDYARQEGFIRAIELCNGSGVCRKMQGGTMCPSFRATRDEKDSTRGRANALRLALSGEEPLKEFRAPWVYDVLDLCLQCKACKAECPSNVDMAKLKAEFLHHYYQGRSRPPGHAAMAKIYAAYRLGTAVAPLANWLGRNRLLRWLLEKVGGIDRRRSMPPLYFSHFRRWFARHQSRRARKPSASHTSRLTPAARQRVVLLDDCFTTFNEPHIGRAAVRVLEHAGCAIELAGLTCCGRPMISKGYLEEARHLVAEQAPQLARRVADGAPLLGLEPSCLLTLADEWPELLPGEDTRRIAAAAHLADGWLAQQVQSQTCRLKLTPKAARCLLHGHCHQKALVGTAGTAAALRLVPDLEVHVLDTGCCGMAGPFGYEKEHYDLSVQVAKLSVLPELEKEPAALVVAPGTSCRHQIKDLARRRALHPLEVLAGQLEENNG